MLWAAATASEIVNLALRHTRIDTWTQHATEERASATTMTHTGVANPLASDYGLAA